MLLIVTASHTINFVFDDRDSITFGAIRRLENIAKKYGWCFHLKVAEDWGTPDEYKGRYVAEYSDSITDLDRRTEEQFRAESEELAKAIKTEVGIVLGTQVPCFEYKY